MCVFHDKLVNRQIRVDPKTPNAYAKAPSSLCTPAAWKNSTRTTCLRKPGVHCYGARPHSSMQYWPLWCAETQALRHVTRSTKTASRSAIPTWDRRTSRLAVISLLRHTVVPITPVKNIFSAFWRREWIVISQTPTRIVSYHCRKTKQRIPRTAIYLPDRANAINPRMVPKAARDIPVPPIVVSPRNKSTPPTPAMSVPKINQDRGKKRQTIHAPRLITPRPSTR